MDQHNKWGIVGINPFRNIFEGIDETVYLLYGSGICKP